MELTREYVRLGAKSGMGVFEIEILGKVFRPNKKRNMIFYKNLNNDDKIKEPWAGCICHKASTVKFIG